MVTQPKASDITIWSCKLVSSLPKDASTQVTGFSLWTISFRDDFKTILANLQQLILYYLP